jgi:hypothetical protein
MLEKDAKSAARNALQNSQRRLARILRARNFGCGQTSGEMRLGGRVSCAERAPLLRQCPAHRATDGQYMAQREGFRLHSKYY